MKLAKVYSETFQKVPTNMCLSHCLYRRLRLENNMSFKHVLDHFSLSLGTTYALSNSFALSHPRKAVGRGEEELCQRGEVTTFDELKLGFGYGEFLAKNVARCKESGGPFSNKVV